MGVRKLPHTSSRLDRGPRTRAVSAACSDGFYISKPMDYFTSLPEGTPCLKVADFHAVGKNESACDGERPW